MADMKLRAPRFRVQLTMVYDTGESYWSGTVVDASESGLFIETTHELPVGARVTLLPDAEGDELPFEIAAQVVRVNEYDLDDHADRTPGLALRFVDLTDEQRQAVRDYLKRRGVLMRRAPA